MFTYCQRRSHDSASKSTRSEHPKHAVPDAVRVPGAQTLDAVRPALGLNEYVINLLERERERERDRQTDGHRQTDR